MTNSFVLSNNLPPRITIKEQTQLLKEFQNGNLDARNKLIESNIRLIYYVISKKQGEEAFEDLLSIGLIGLIKAVNTYKLDKKVELSTYAVKCIKNEINMYFRKENKNINNISIDNIIINKNNNNNLTILETLKDDKENVESYYEQTELRYELLRILESLDQESKEIILLSFGFVGNKRYTQKEISEIYNKTQSCISRKLKMALIILKKEYFKSQGLKYVLEKQKNV